LRWAEHPDASFVVVQNQPQPLTAEAALEPAAQNGNACDRVPVSVLEAGLRDEEGFVWLEVGPGSMSTSYLPRFGSWRHSSVSTNLFAVSTWASLGRYFVTDFMT